MQVGAWAVSFQPVSTGTGAMTPPCRYGVGSSVIGLEMGP